MAEITLPELDRLSKAWRSTPPPHLLLSMLAQGMVGWKPPEPEKPFRESSPEEFAAFASAFGGLKKPPPSAIQPR